VKGEVNDVTGRSPAEAELFAAADWDIPVTEDFVDRVGRGLRRRRFRRAAVAGGSLLATAAVTGTIVIAVNAAGPTSGGPMPAGPGTAASTPRRVTERIDGFVLGYLPAGVRRNGPDGFYTAGIGPEGLRSDSPAPAEGEPSVAVTMRRLTLAPGNHSMFVTVLRPQTGTRSAMSAEQMGGWLAEDAGANDRAESFPVPAGRAYLIIHRGTEVTTASLVIAAPNGVVVMVEGHASLTVDELRRIAEGVST
jgi:hypothetical protein